MSKYTPATFQPTVRPDWAGILSYLSDKEKGEILVALFKYPSVECESAFWKETIKPELDLQYQAFIESCKAKSRGVRNRWGKISITNVEDMDKISIRYDIDTEREREREEKSKSDNKGGVGGKEGEKFTPPTEKEVLAYAKQMNDLAGTGGFKCTEQQALLFHAYFERMKWKDKNGTPVYEWEKAFKYWVRRDEQNGYSKEQDKKTPRMSLKEMKEAENHIKLQKMLNGEL